MMERSIEALNAALSALGRIEDDLLNLAEAFRALGMTVVAEKLEARVHDAHHVTTLVLFILTDLKN
jgi:hypothetical protein